MIRVLILLIGVVALGVSICSSQPWPVTEFFPVADSITNFPPLDQKLAIICQKKIDRWYVSFVGLKNDPLAMIAVVTASEFAAPDSIALTVAFNGYHPSTGKYPIWGYIFDRNRDGKIDYMSLVSGAAGFKGEDFPGYFPLRNQMLDRNMLEYFVGHCKLIFNHWADDNFDGKIDAVVHVDMDSVRDWVERRIVARSTTFEEKFDDVWGFHQSIAAGAESLAFSPDQIPFHSPEKPNDQLTWQRLREKSGILSLLNRAVKACGLKPSQFFHPEVRE